MDTTNPQNAYHTSRNPRRISAYYAFLLAAALLAGCDPSGTESHEEPPAGWNTLPSGTSLNLNAIDFASPEIAYAVGDTGVILKTRDGGNTWVRLNTRPWSDSVLGALPDLNKIQCVSEMICIALGNSYLHSVLQDTVNGWMQSRNIPTLLRTTNGGETWHSIIAGSFTDLRDLVALDFPHPDTGYVFTHRRAILKTTNGGATWLATFPHASSGFWVGKSIQFISGNVGYTQMSDGQIHKTTDGGITWQALFEYRKYEGDYLDLFVVDSSTIYGVGSQGILLKGMPWESRTLDGNPDLTAIRFLNRDTGYIATYTGRLLTTKNGGASWDETVISTHPLNAIAISPTGQIYLVGNEGVIYRKQSP